MAPHLAAPRTIAAELAKILRSQRRTDAELRPTRVNARNGDGTLALRRLDGECVARGSNCEVRAGQVIEVPCRPPFSLQGASGLAMNSVRRSIGALWVEALDPPTFPPGFVGTVTVTGGGFLPITRIDFLDLDGETVNEDIETTARRFISATELELDLDVAADAEVLLDPATGAPLPLPISYDNPGANL